MITLNFDPQASLIRLRVTLEHEYQKSTLMVFDPGASITVITPQLAEALGYELSQTRSTTSIYTAGGMVRARQLTLPSLSLYGEGLESVEVLCSPLPQGIGADGLLGLNVLRHFKINLDFASGVLILDRIE